MPSPQAELPLWDEPPPSRGGGELRRVVLGDRIVPYVLRRGRRRTIGLTIDQRGLRVGAPPRAALGEIESLIRKHAAWVVDKLDSWRDRPSASVQTVTDGMSIPVLGEALALRIVAGNNSFRWPDADGAAPGELVLALRDGANAGAVLERALRDRAREVFARRLDDFCQRFSIVPPALRLTSARTRWGSCSRLSGVRLNWRLIHAPLPLVDYVVAHELAHLKEMNHTPRFWAEVTRLYPDWPVARKALRGFGDGLPRFS